MSYTSKPLTELEYTPVLFERIAELEAENEQLREQVKLLDFQLTMLRRHPEFHHLDKLREMTR